MKIQSTLKETTDDEWVNVLNFIDFTVSFEVATSFRGWNTKNTKNMQIIYK